MPNIQLVPECYAETAMVRELFANQDYLNHAEGISRVNYILEQEDIANYCNVGFVDNDKKNTPRYFDEFNEIERSGNVIFKQHPQSNDYLIIVNPAIERFLLEQLQHINKTPVDFDLPDDFKGFRKKLKSNRIESNEGYIKMIRELITKKAPGIVFIMEKVNSLR